MPVPAAAPTPVPVVQPAFVHPAHHGEFDAGQPIVWVAVPGTSEYCLTVGSTPGGDDIVNTGPLPPSQTMFAAPSLPADRELFARIYSSVNGRWSHAEVVFRAPADQTPHAALTWPAEGARGVDSERPFNWSRVPWATNYWLTIGTTEGGSDLLNTGPLPAGQSSFAALPPFPAGQTLYARLLTCDGVNWTYTDVTFTA
jgi:hypothetical protein